MLIEKFKLFMMNLEILLINFLGVKLVKLVACGSEIDSSTLRINVDVLSSCHELPVFSKKLKFLKMNKLMKSYEKSSSSEDEAPSDRDEIQFPSKKPKLNPCSTQQ